MSERNDGIAFERLCADILKKLGWNVRMTDKTNDKGIDIIASRRVMPAEAILGCQCKAYTSGNVGSKEVRDFAGALMQAKLKEGWVFTLSDFTEEAKIAARAINDSNQLKITLINAASLKNLNQDADNYRELLMLEVSAFQRRLSGELSGTKQELKAEIYNHGQMLVGRTIRLENELGQLQQAHKLALADNENLKKLLSRNFKVQAFINIAALIAVAVFVFVLRQPKISEAAISTLSQHQLPSKAEETTKSQPFANPQEVKIPNFTEASAQTHRSIRVKTADLSEETPAVPEIAESQNFRTRQDYFHKTLSTLLLALDSNKICDKGSTVRSLQKYLKSNEVRTTRENKENWDGVLKAYADCDDSVPFAEKSSDRDQAG